MQLFIPRVFKLRAIKALKGNWQTALLVSFFASFFTLALNVASELLFPEVSYLYMGDAQRFVTAALAVPDSSVMLLGILSSLSALMTPVLVIGANNYYLNRLKGQELGFTGLFSRFSSFLRCLWLYVLMFVKTFLWTCLLFVPGIMAAFRYAMAPYYLAQDPTLTATQAIEMSKKAMQNAKMSLFLLELSFIGWSLLNSLLSLMLFDISPVLSTVVSLLISTVVTAYLNGSCAAFFQTVSDPMKAARESMSPDVGTPPQGDENEPLDGGDDSSEDE